MECIRAVLVAIAAALVFVPAARAADRPPERLVGIAYSTWLTPDTWRSTWDEPLDGPYRSDDPAVIRRHAAQLSAAGVDFLLVDWSNNVDHVAGDTRHPHQAFIERATHVLFDEFAALPARPRIAIMLGTSEHPEAARDGRLQRKADQVWNDFVSNPKYRSLIQHHLGKPLLVVYANTPSPYGRVLPWNDDRFTVRWMTGYVTQQPALRLSDEVSAGYWSWEERGRQTYTVHDGAPEAMTVVASWREDTHADIPARGRDDGRTFQEQWQRVHDVGPTIALVVGWNEWVKSEQPSAEISKDIEPSRIHGRRYLDLLAEEVRRFKHPGSEVARLLARNTVPKTVPRRPDELSHLMHMQEFPILGNGCLMVTVAGKPEALTAFIGKTDFWRSSFFRGDQSGNCLAASLRIKADALAGAAMHQVQDMHLAEVRTTLSKGAARLEMRMLTPHEADWLFTDLVNAGSVPLELSIETCAEQFASPSYKANSLPFDITAAAPGQIAVVSRKTHVPVASSFTESFRMWAAAGTRVLDADVTATVKELPREQGEQRAAADLEANVKQTISLEPGRTLRIATHVVSTGLPITADPADPRPKVVERLQSLTAKESDALIAIHRDWWSDYWKRSHVRLDQEPLVERAYFGGLYHFACANRVGAYPAGINGWPVNDNVMWGGDYHWDYNQAAINYAAYSADRIALTEPYDRIVREANEFGVANASRAGVPGSLWIVATGPGHVNENSTWHMKTHGIEAVQNHVSRYLHTYDTDWARANYKVFKDLAAYWDWDLQQTKETLGNGSYRYVVTESTAMEVAANDRFNATTALAFLRRFFRGMIAITRDLNATGFDTGHGSESLARWQDILDHLSGYPETFAYGRRVWAWSEESLNPFTTNQCWNLYPVFPASDVNLSSPPRLLEVARNTIRVRPFHYFQFENSLCQIFTMAARVGLHPPEILERFRARYAPLGCSNLLCSASNVENVAIVESVHSMLLQSQEGFLRLFPAWDREHAIFRGIRTEGAFLVSAEKKNGVCQPFTVFSERGRPCSILNPWPGRTLLVDGQPVPAESRVYGQVCTFPTRPGTTYEISSKEPLPSSLPHWNAALYKPVSTSSDYQPPKEPANWRATKLTDGARLNTQFGHRGWTSAVHDSPAATEWVQVDLGEAVPIERIDVWPIDHGDALSHTHCAEPFIRSSEIDQSYDGFPLDFRILVSTDGSTWEEIAVRKSFRRPAVGDPASDLKPRDVTGPESFPLAKPADVRYVKVEATKLRCSRTWGRHAMQLAEIEAVRADVSRGNTR